MMIISASHSNRIISGLLMAAVLFACLALGGWPLRILVTAASMLGLWEFYQMFWPGRTRLPDKAVGFAATAIICLCSGREVGTAVILGILGIMMMFCAVRFLLEYGGGNDSAKLPENGVSLLGIMYIPLSLHLAIHLSLPEQCVVFLGAFCSDIGAYYVGCNLGKRRLWPRVSPKKSMEGALGGMLAGMLAVTVLTLIVAVPGMEGISFWGWAIIGILLSIAAQVGDLFESALKRVRNVKDSSNLIPGHGGMLDRVDSLLFVVPVYMLVKIFVLFGQTAMCHA